MSVNKTLVEIKGEHSINQPKAKAGRRMIPLAAVAVEALREHRKKLPAEGNPGPSVFPDTHGGYVRKSNLMRRSFASILKRAQPPKIRFHDLRHGEASLLLKQNVHPKSGLHPVSWSVFPAV